MPTPKTVECPTCQQPVIWSPESKFRPFCSERCRMIDFGEWASESHAIPGETVLEDESNASSRSGASENET